MTRQRSYLVVPFLAMLAVAVACSSAPSPGTVAPVPASAPAAPPASKAAGGSATSQSATTVSPESSGTTIDQRMIIRTGHLDLTVKDVNASMDAVTRLADRYGGYVLSSSLQSEDDRPYATMSLKVPSESFDSALHDLRQIGTKVTSESSSGQDVTDQYVDLNAQLKNLQATEAQYLDLMKKAQTVEDILRVQQQLTDVQGQIERLQGQINLIQQRTSLSQIDVTLQLDAPGWQPFRGVQPAWQASLQAIEVLIDVVVFLWWTVPLGGIIYGIVRLLRGRKRGRMPQAPPSPTPT